MRTLRLVGLGTGAALALALPAALAAQVLDVLDDGDDAPPGTYALALLVLLGMAVGGWVVGREGGSLPVAALSGLIAIGIVQVLGVVRLVVAGEDVDRSSLPLTAVAGVALATAGCALATRWAARTRR